MKNIFSILLVMIFFLVNVNNQLAFAKEDKEFNIGIVFDGPSQLNNVVLNLVKKEIDELTEAEFYMYHILQINNIVTAR